MMLGEYAGYVLSAYAIAALCVAALIAKTLFEARRLKADLARIERDAAGRSG